MANHPHMPYDNNLAIPPGLAGGEHAGNCDPWRSIRLCSSHAGACHRPPTGHPRSEDPEVDSVAGRFPSPASGH